MHAQRLSVIMTLFGSPNKDIVIRTIIVSISGQLLWARNVGIFRKYCRNNCRGTVSVGIIMILRMLH